MGKNKYELSTMESEFCFAVYFTERSFAKFFSKILKEFKLTFTQYVTLLVLWQEQRPVKMSEITSLLQLDYGTTSPLFKRMEKNEWVVRRYSANDKRQVYIELTEKGKSKEKIINGRVKEYLNSINDTNDDYKKGLQSIYKVNNKIKDVNDYLEDLF